MPTTKLSSDETVLLEVARLSRYDPVLPDMIRLSGLWGTKLDPYYFDEPVQPERLLLPQHESFHGFDKSVIIDGRYDIICFSF